VYLFLPVRSVTLRWILGPFHNILYGHIKPYLNFERTMNSR
jgi:hypothetical protein